MVFGAKKTSAASAAKVFTEIAVFEPRKGVGQVGGRGELAGRRSLGFHSGGAEASASARFKEKKN